MPFYRLGAGPNFLNVTMVAAVCGGAVPVFRAARHHLRNEWHALVPALAFLLNYAAEWMLQETWHPEVMAIPFLLAAYVAAIEGRWRAYAVWLVVALSWKEDVGLAVLMLGFLLAVRGRKTLNGDEGPVRTRRYGVMTALAGAGYFVVVTQFVIPHFSTVGNFTEVFFGDLGSSSPEIAKSILTRPDLVREHLARSNPFNYVQELTGSFGFIAFLSPLALLMGLPQATVNLLTNQNFFWPTRVHYAAMPLFAVTVASVEGLARFRQIPVRRVLLGAMAAGTFFTAVTWGVSPLSTDFRKGHWPLVASGTHDRYAQALSLPGPDDAVSVQYNFTAHVTRRHVVYTFPNPWIASNWALNGENRPDPDEVDWIIINPSTLDKTHRAVLAAALSDPATLQTPGTEGFAPEPDKLATAADPAKWSVLTDTPDLFVARRTRT